MDERNTTDDQAARAASLSRAAESLAKAAAKLAEAARAMSLVAGVLSQGDLAKLSNLGGSESTPLCLDQTDHTASTDSKEDDGAGLPQPHRLLLDDEADIFLLLCSIIYYHSKVVCYITCNSSLLKLYKGLIDSVTETSALIPASPSKSAIEICYDKFLQKTRSVVLFSETDIPSIPAKEISEYTVIHVGWPVDKRRYVAQRRAHHASTNILLAYSGDKQLYPSGSEIMSQTVDWPGDTGGFRASADILRPLFEERLSELSFETKEEAYLDWIQLHARQGPRFVNSWTPSDLIRRANRFILGPLAYRSPRSLTQQSTLKAPLLDLLPEVPTEFVTQHGLQPAVDEGLLRVEPDGEVDAGHADGSYSANGLSAEDTRPRDGSEVPSPSLLYQSSLGGNNYGELHPVSPRMDANDAQERPVIEPSLEDETGTRSTSPDVPQRPTGVSLLTPNSSNQPHRLLVNTEADVLLFTCAIMSKHQQTICYMPCGPVALKTYKLLIESVTDVLVHVVESSKKDDVYGSFLQVEGTVLLVPESLSPKIEIPGESSWVIHVGWPASEMQYIVQQKNHHAQNNIIIACSADQSLYQSGDIIVNMTEPWPKDGASFRASVSILRPLYEAMLSEIPLEMKEHVYQDWMQFHGIHGPRQVKTWSPITIVERANSYLSDVIQWGREYEGGLPFPEVSAGFVAQNGLELAVQQGILTVETDSDPDEPPTTPRPESMDTQTEFYPTTGHTYFALDEEFDVIPLICFLSEQYGKVICFLEGQGSLTSYQKLFHKITKRLVIFPSTINDKPAVEEAVVQFLTESTPVILLLAVSTKNLPVVLKQGSVDCCIYWGFSNPLKQAKKNRDLINCATSIVILMKSQEGSIKSLYGVTIHPSAGIHLDRTKDSIMATARNKTKSALLSTKGVVDSLYGSRLYALGFGLRKKGAEETVRQLNRYAARALLHGEPEDGSEIFPPVAGRPKAYKKLVEKFDLQAAVDAGLLRLK